MFEHFVQDKPSPLLLLLRVNATHSWRRLMALRDQSQLLTAIIALFIGGYLVLSFWLFYYALKFIAKFPGLGAVLTERLVFVLFAFLFAMLLLSNVVIGYTNLFRNRETAFLLTMPVSMQTIFRWKFIESMVLASWAFLFLIAPLLVAFGLVREVPWHFYVVTILLIGLFIVLPSVIGAWLAILVGRFLDRRNFQIAIVATALVLLAIGAFWWKSQAATNDVLDKRTLEALDQLLAKTHFTMFPFLPSFWLSSAVLQWAEGILRGATFFALVLLSNTLFFGGIAFTRFGGLFYNTASAVQSRAGGGLKINLFRSAENPRPVPGPARKVRRLVYLLRPRHPRSRRERPAHVLARHHAMGPVRDALRSARRLHHQPAQLHAPALQSVLDQPRRLSEPRRVLVEPRHRHHAVCVPAIFPRRPPSVDHRHGAARAGTRRHGQILAVEHALAHRHARSHHAFLLAAEHGLGRLAFFGAVVAVMTFALNGLAVGLGVLYPNLKEANPGKIVSGFGGTLCLVLSFLYILASVLLLAFGTIGIHTHASWAVGSIIVFVLLSLLIGWLPLRWGLQQLKNFEA